MTKCQAHFDEDSLMTILNDAEVRPATLGLREILPRCAVAQVASVERLSHPSAESSMKDGGMLTHAQKATVLYPEKNKGSLTGA